MTKPPIIASAPIASNPTATVVKTSSKSMGVGYALPLGSGGVALRVSSLKRGWRCRSGSVWAVGPRLG